MQLALYLCFLFSGAAGLLYESYWSDRFSLLLGLDVYSQAAVLTAFMGGLALGSEWAARRGDASRRPWRAYALLELGIAACGLVIPLVIDLFEPFLRWVYQWSGAAPLPMLLARFAVAVLLILGPTALMGATLPIMALALRREGERLGTVVGRLYAMNTAGAVLGILSGGFILAEAIGLSGVNAVAVVLNVLAAGLALLAGARSRAGGAAVMAGGVASAAASDGNVGGVMRGVGATVAVGPGDVACIAAGAALTGAGAMITQIGWIRILSLCIGSSSYAFSLIVAVFLVGLSLGAVVAARMMRRAGDAAVPWSVMCLLAAGLCLAVMLPLGMLPLRVEEIIGRLLLAFQSIPLAYTGIGVLVFGILLLPTLALGTTLPLACEAFAQRRGGGTARDSGALYAVNTLGAMAGSALGGLVLMNAFGMQGALRLGAALYACAALLAARVAKPARRPTFAAALIGSAVLAAAAGFALAVPWDRAALIQGPYLLRGSRYDPKILYFRDAPEGTVAVVETAQTKNIALVMSGKPEASTAIEGDMPTQVMLGQLGGLLHGAPRSVAVIGLGSGVTLHSVLTQEVEQVECIELSQAVVDAVRPPDGSSGPFDAVNGRALDDPRVRLVIADGRNHLRLTTSTYDLIVSEPSNPWMGGVASLFTREFFVTCRERLRPGGILCQWLQAYALPPTEFCRVVQTVAEVFPSCSIWRSQHENDYVLIATEAPRPALGHLARVLSRPGVKADLERFHVRNVPELLGLYIVDAASLRGRSLGPGEPRFGTLRANTDDRNLLKYGAMRGLWMPGDLFPYQTLASYRALPLDWTGPLDRSDPEGRGLIEAIEDVQDLQQIIQVYAATRDPRMLWVILPLPEAESYVAAMRTQRLPPRPPADESLLSGVLERARERLRGAEGKSGEAAISEARFARYFARVGLAISPDHPEATAVMADALRLMGRRAAAVALLDEAGARGVSVAEDVRARLAAPP